MRAAWILSLCATVVAAQEPPNIKVDVNLVNLACSVRDARGALAAQLTRDDFEVVEDGVAQKLSFFGRSLDLPLTLGLIVDVSGSQEEFAKQHHRDIDEFLKRVLRPQDRAFLICFGNHLRLVSDFSSDSGQLMDQLKRFEHGERGFPELGPRDEDRDGGTALFDALIYSSEKFQNEPGRKALVVFSDGEDNASAHHLIDAIEAAQGSGAVAYAIRYTEMKHGRLNARNKYGTRVLDRLAQDTGGRAFDALKVDLKDAFEEIEQELRSLYELAYASTSPAAEGSFRKVTVRVKQPGYKVRTKAGYFAR